MQDDTAPANAEEYHEHYKSFDAMPFAFTDIEMVFDEERRAVDWIFRYATLRWQSWKNCRWNL